MSEQHLWNQIKKALQDQSPVLRSVLNNITLESPVIKGQKHFVFQTPSSFHQDILKKHLHDIQVQMKKRGEVYKSILIKTDKKKRELLKVSSSSKPSFSRLKKRPSSSSFFHQWTFSSFVPGPSNSFAFSLAQNVAKKPIKNQSNPLFIYGPSGLGKTHLLHAIGNALEQEKPHLKTFYLPAERFLNDCITHISKNDMPAFRQKYRNNTHVLLLDDIQILGRGESTQEEFFNTFECLKQKGCQVVLASDQKPKSIKGLKERIKTRLEGGVIIDIQVPDKDTIKAIIRNKARKALLKLSEEIISYIADLPINSVRETEGHLNKIKMYCELQNRPLSLSLIQKLLPEEPLSLPSAEPYLSHRKTLATKSLQKEICSRYHIKLPDLKSKSRSKNMVKARNIAIYISRKELNLTLEEIGYLFGKRNHSTIVHSLKSVEKQQKTNIQMSNSIKELSVFIRKKYL